tara:strand:- start:473 stop:688 length:216 start_codon:yes stop_codon:yes gene_type:complete
MSEIILPESTQKHLRENSVISSEEVAIQIGDLFVSENVLSKERRQINPTAISNLSVSEKKENFQTKTLLKG